MQVTEKHKQYGTRLQIEAVDAMLEAGNNQAKAAKLLGIPRPTLQSRLIAVIKKASNAGYAPDFGLTEELAPGQHLKGATTAYKIREDGTRVPVFQWVKSDKTKEDRAEAMREAIESLCEPLKGLHKKTKPPKLKDKDLMCVYPLGDPHLGLLSWHVETGQDFNLKIAESQLCGAMDQLVDLAPAAERCVIMNLGDFFHSDNPSNRTARSGNALDVDSRWGHVLQVGIRSLRHLIEAALKKHKYVDVTCSIGNHDDMSSQMLATAMQCLFEKEPRVKVLEPSVQFHYIQHGKCLFGTTHGHTIKYKDLPGIMAVDEPKAWGATQFRYWYTGHVHHESVKDFPGVTVETFRTLAASDAWHHSSGYRSQKDARLDIWHKDFGLINRHIVGIERLRSK